jgi:hypothetical protein
VDYEEASLSKSGYEIYNHLGFFPLIFALSSIKKLRGEESYYLVAADAESKHAIALKLN